MGNLTPLPGVIPNIQRRARPQPIGELREDQFELVGVQPPQLADVPLVVAGLEDLGQDVVGEVGRAEVMVPLLMDQWLAQCPRHDQCPILALSQLSRKVEDRHPPIPVLADLRESGSIEQDADIVLMLYRQGAYDEDCEDPALTDVYDRLAHVLGYEIDHLLGPVRKNRNGPTGRVELRFEKENMRFREPRSAGEPKFHP